MNICWACDGKGFYMRGIAVVDCGYCQGTGITGEKESEKEK